VKEFTPTPIRVGIPTRVLHLALHAPKTVVFGTLTTPFRCLIESSACRWNSEEVFGSPGNARCPASAIYQAFWVQQQLGAFAATFSVTLLKQV
jgi:hypothetical protein